MGTAPALSDSLYTLDVPVPTTFTEPIVPAPSTAGEPAATLNRIPLSNAGNSAEVPPSTASKYKASSPRTVTSLLPFFKSPQNLSARVNSQFIPTPEPDVNTRNVAVLPSPTIICCWLAKVARNCAVRVLPYSGFAGLTSTSAGFE